jgi:hypothetical protein
VQGYGTADFPLAQQRASVLCQTHWTRWQAALGAAWRFTAPAYGLNKYYAGQDCALVCTPGSTAAHVELTGALSPSVQRGRLWAS